MATSSAWRSMKVLGLLCIHVNAAWTARWAAIAVTREKAEVREKIAMRFQGSRGGTKGHWDTGTQGQ